MDTSGIRHAGDWPFPLSPNLERSIEGLIDAMENDEGCVGEWAEQVRADAQDLSEEKDWTIYQYYYCGGWRKDVRGGNI